MRITITTETGELHNVEVDSQIELENMKALIEEETGTPTSQQILFFNGCELKDPKKTLEQYGVIQDSILLLRKQPSTSASTTHGGSEAERMMQSQLIQMLQQPDLAARFAESLRQQEINNANLLDIETQRKIEEDIKQENIMANMTAALEFHPESFGRVIMLYINVEVNGRPVKAFVDSGAQETIMSPTCAESCGIMRLVDKRWAGIAEGVGTAKILGRVHSAQIRVGPDLFLACSFLVMEGRGVDLLFGLDMLKRHQACIDLKRNALIINDKEIPFLPEHELPVRPSIDEIVVEDQTSPLPSTNLSPTSSGNNNSVSINTNPPLAGHSIPNNNTSSGLSSDTAMSTQSKYPEEDIQELVRLGMPRAQAIQLLDMAGGNPDLAASLFLDS